MREEVESSLALQAAARQALEPDAPAAGTSPILAQREAAKSRQRDRETLDRVKQAIAAAGELRNRAKSRLDMDVKPGQEAQAVREIVDVAKNYKDLGKSGVSPDVVKKENADLRGQVAFLKNRLDARGGRDYPPCWADEKSGKVEFLFTIELRPDNVSVVPAWPPGREADARALPGIANVLSGSPHSNSSFVSHIQEIFGKSQALQCRHYVQLKSVIPDAVQSDRARLMVEYYFYKTEMRR